MSRDWFFIMLVMKIIKKWLLNGGVHKLAMMCNRHSEYLSLAGEM